MAPSVEQVDEAGVTSVVQFERFAAVQLRPLLLQVPVFGRHSPSALVGDVQAAPLFDAFEQVPFLPVHAATTVAPTLHTVPELPDVLLHLEIVHWLLPVHARLGL